MFHVKHYKLKKNVFFYKKIVIINNATATITFEPGQDRKVAAIRIRIVCGGFILKNKKEVSLNEKTKLYGNCLKTC